MAPNSENSLLLTENLGRVWASLIIDELLKLGIDNFFISPGLRNAPLLAAISKARGLYPKRVKALVGVDERAQAYRALGYAKATGKPGVLVCTSGTAMANYYPAIIEAQQTDIPLIVLTADRPVELIWGGDNQTINQTKLYGDYLKAQLLLPVPDEAIAPLALKQQLDEVIHQLKQAPMGPVHINLPLRDPLSSQVVKLSDSYLQKCHEAVAHSVPTVAYDWPALKPAPQLLDRLVKELKTAQRPLLVIGAMNPESDKRGLIELCEQFPGALYLDIESGLKNYFPANERLIPSFDHPEIALRLKQLAPDFILQVGGKVVSKHFYLFLQQQNQGAYWQVQATTRRSDPVDRPKQKCFADPLLFAADLNLKLKRESFASTQKTWAQGLESRAIVEQKGNSIEAFGFKHNCLTFPHFSKTIMEMVPDQSALFLGNSTAIRSFDLYASLGNQKEIQVIANRGVSGIEGLLATAVGVCEAQGRRTTIVLGDISLLHDLNSLYLVDQKQKELPLIILIANNNSGGIFSLLPIAQEFKQDQGFAEFLTTPHNYQFAKVCAQFNLPYEEVREVQGLARAYQAALNQKGACVIEVTIDQAQTIELYQQLKTVK